MKVKIDRHNFLFGHAVAFMSAMAGTAVCAAVPICAEDYTLPRPAQIEYDANGIPSDAVVLFDGKSLDKWEGMDGGPARWVVKEDGTLLVNKAGNTPGKVVANILTKESFGACQLHLEFRIPPSVGDVAQSQWPPGNSGVFFLGCYEVQILGSKNRDMYANGLSAAIYNREPPAVHAAKDPGCWETFDIVFNPPVLENGCVREQATVTMFQNGVLVHDHVAVPPYPDIAANRVKTIGKIMLQAHNDPSEPISFRNIWVRPLPGQVPPKADIEAMAAILARPGALAEPKAPRRVLLVSKCFGYVHKDAILWGDAAFKLASRLGAYRIDTAADFASLTNASRLARYDAIILNNTTSVSVTNTPGLEAALTGFVKSGKGLCLIHSSIDSFYDSPAVQEMAGGLFFGHPWPGPGRHTFVNERPENPINASFDGAPKLYFSDEIYMQKTPPYSRDNCTVLVSLDNEEWSNKNYEKVWREHPHPAVRRFPIRADRDFAVSWIKSYGKGRVFYTSFGHDNRAFLDPPRLLHIMAGLQYAIGDIEAGVPCK